MVLTNATSSGWVQEFFGLKIKTHYLNQTTSGLVGLVWARPELSKNLKKIGLD